MSGAPELHLWNNFNRIATIYDSLARFFFGQSIIKCQTRFLHLIPEGSDILILGGGTGWIIEAVKRKTSNCIVWYVEQSSRMISLAKSKPDMSGVVFIHGSISSIPKGHKFDAVITNFFLDLFPDFALREILNDLNVSLKPGGLWMVSDFVNNHWWHGVYLWMMYRFFRLTTGIEAKRLPHWEALMTKSDIVKKESKFYYGGFLKSIAYNKITAFD